MHGSPPILISLAACLLAGCRAAPVAYAPPEQTVLIPMEPQPLKRMLNMDDADARKYFIKDINEALESGAWRWSFERPEMQFRLASVDHLKLTVDFAVSEDTFRHTGPMSVDFYVNEQRAGTMPCPNAGRYHFERELPPGIAKAGEATLLAIQPSRVWVAPSGVHYGLILVRAGFVS